MTDRQNYATLEPVPMKETITRQAKGNWVAETTVWIVIGLWEHYESHLTRNYPGYWTEFRWYIFFAGCVAALDFLSTVHLMQLHGIEHELHPGIRWLSIILGPVLGPLIGKIGQFCCLIFMTIYLRPFARIIFLPVTFLYGYAAWFNFHGSEIYTPLFLRIIHFGN